MAGMVGQTYQRALPSVTIHITQHSDPCHLTTSSTPLATAYYTVSQNPCTSLQCTVVNIMVFNKIFNEGAGNVFVRLTGTYDI
jgi:hypothetical protein